MKKKRTAKKQKKGDVRVPDLGDDIGVLLCGSDGDGAHRGLTDGDYLVLLCGNSRGLRKLGKYLIALAGLDTSDDSSFHHHFPHLRSLSDTKLQLMIRKNNAAHYDWMRQQSDKKTSPTRRHNKPATRGADLKR